MGMANPMMGMNPLDPYRYNAMAMVNPYMMIPPPPRWDDQALQTTIE